MTIDDLEPSPNSEWKSRDRQIRLHSDTAGVDSDESQNKSEKVRHNCEC